ncbi:hypothetical protein LguiA_008004 [Lonicera macranthoides]
MCCSSKFEKGRSNKYHLVKTRKIYSSRQGYIAILWWPAQLVCAKDSCRESH